MTKTILKAQKAKYKKKKNSMKNLIRNCLYLAVVSITVAGSVLSTSAAEEVSIAGFPSAVIKQPNAEYVESTVGLQVKV